MGLRKKSDELSNRVVQGLLDGLATRDYNSPQGPYALCITYAFFCEREPDLCHLQQGL